MHASLQLASTVQGRGGADSESHRQAAYPQDAVIKERAGKTHQEHRRDHVNQSTTCQMEQPGPSSSTIRWDSYKNKTRKALFNQRTLAQVSLSSMTIAV